MLLVNSWGDADGDDLIAHNFFQDNANVPFDASAMFFNAASGWLVSRNNFTGNGTNPSASSDANIVMLSGSNGNVFDRNTGDNNFGPGTFVDTGAINNSFLRNHVTWNSGGLPNADPTMQTFSGGWDLGDGNPVGVNNYKKNICRFSAGPGVPAGQCNPTVN
jgi:hypothetical protein